MDGIAREGEGTGKIMSQRDKPLQGVLANTLNGARGKRCDIDGKAEGRMSGSECRPES